MSKGKRLRLRGESIIMLQGPEEIWLMCLRDWTVLAGTFFRRRSQSYEQWENNGISKKRCPNKLPNKCYGFQKRSIGERRWIDLLPFVGPFYRRANRYRDDNEGFVFSRPTT